MLTAIGTFVTLATLVPPLAHCASSLCASFATV
jgi:hypothetical protein